MKNPNPNPNSQSQFPVMNEIFVETLEHRIAPASLAGDHHSATFQDANGDTILVSVSKGTLSEANFAFASGAFGDTGPQTLKSLKLDDLQFKGANVSISVVASGSGPGAGHAEIGEILATNVDLGTVSVQGGLVKIAAGDAKPSSGIKSLSVETLGMLNPADFGDLTGRTSTVVGTIGSLSINGDMGGTLAVTGAKAGISTATITGSLLGGAGDQAGWISTAGGIKSILIGGSIDGSAADTAKEAGISAGGLIKSISVTGDLLGGSQDYSGSIQGASGIGSLTVGGDVVGAAGKFSGSIQAGVIIVTPGNLQVIPGKLSSVSIVGDVLGGAGDHSASIVGWAGIGSVSVGGDLHGGTAKDSGTIQAGGEVVVPNSDPTKPSTSQTVAGDISSVFIGKDVIGNDGLRSASILAWGKHDAKLKTIGGHLGEIQVGGNVTGGAGQFSSLIYGYAAINEATIGHDVTGGAGSYSGRIATDAGALGTVTVGGSLKGGLGANSGTIFAGTEDGVGGKARPGDIKSLHITEDVVGGGGQISGLIEAEGAITSLVIDGNLQGGTKADTGAIFANSAKSIAIGKSVIGTNFNSTGYIQVTSSLGDLSIGENLIGGSSPDANVTGTGAIVAGLNGKDASASPVFASIGSVTIGGKIQSGDPGTHTLQNSGAIRANGTIGSVTADSIVGNEKLPVWITGLFNQKAKASNSVAIGSIDIAKDVSYALIASGIADLSSSSAFSPYAPYARIGSVTVGGNWSASSISAGANPGTSGYGSGDTLISDQSGATGTAFSRIDSVTIGGTVHGGAAGKQFGFVAQQFGSVTIGGVAQALPFLGQTTNVIGDGSVKIHVVTPDGPLPPP